MEDNIVNRLRVSDMLRINNLTDNEVRSDIISVLEEIPFIYNLCKADRKRVHELERWDSPYSSNRRPDPNGRIAVDITDPHVLEDMDYFRQPAIYFKKHGRYTDYVKNNHPRSRYMIHWKEEQRRCREGYVRESDGEWITGYNYWYLNYCPIMITDTKTADFLTATEDLYELHTSFESAETFSDTITVERIEDFPKVWDSDYLWFHYVEQAEKKGKHCTNIKTRGRGYEQPYSAIIKTLHGDTTMGDVKVGDKILTPSGDEANVVEKYEQGIKDVYKVTFSDGREVECGLDHLWAVYKNYQPSKKKPYQVLRLEDIINDGLYYDTSQNQRVYKYRIPDIHPVMYEENEELPIHPYILGALLGDGSMSTPSIKIASDDEELLQHFRDILGSDYVLNKDLTTTNNYLICYNPAKKMYKKVSPLKEAVKDLGVNVSCKHKFIPDIYKRSSYQSRVFLIKGLMDTDGSINNKGFVEFTNTSEELIDDLADVFRSLGISCKKSYVERTGESSVTMMNGKQRTIVRNNYFRLYIHTNHNVFTLSRKTARVRKKDLFTKPFIRSIEKIRQEKSACILIDSDEHVYLTNGFIPTHNSFKGGAMLGRNYYHFKKSKSFAIASEGDYLIGDAILDKTWDVLSFIDTHTPWVKARDIKNTTDHKKASYIDPKTKIEQGIKTEIIGVTTKNQPEKARGKRGKLLLFEEAGKFPHLIKAHTIARPSVEQGRYVFGTIISWGTGGTEGADFDGLRELFTNPSAHNILGIPNNYDRKVYGKKECGFYCGEYMNREGLTDENGNSDVIAALIEIFIGRRELSRSTNDPNVLIQERAERSITPDEAMMRKEGHIFNVEDLKHQLSEVQLHPKKYADSFWKVNLYMKDGSVYYRNSTTPPVRQYPIKENKGLTGCIEIYEHPITESPQRGLYIAGTDPYDDDTSLGPSLGCTFIMNRLTRRIVAEYTGRPNTAEDFYENTLRMLMYYNAVCNYENNKKGMFGYFDKMKSLHYLADTPKILKDMQVVKSTGRGNTLKGTNATGGVNKYGNSLTRSYLVDAAYNKEGERNWQQIPSEGLLKELISFDPNDGNYDRVAAFRMLMILLAEYDRYEIDDDIEDRESKPAIDPFFLRTRPSLANRFSGIEVKDRTNDKRLIRR